MNGTGCPIGEARYREIVSAHGAGGRLMHSLIRDVFLGGEARGAVVHDGAVLDVGGGRIAFTTDSYTVTPLFFPGGDIGSLSVWGTGNDLAMCGARPRWLSCGVILEEGFPVEILERIMASMRSAAEGVGAEIVTGDTKVVERGKGDGIYINTAGIGWVHPAATIGPNRIVPGDLIILNGDIGRHGIAILTAREGLEFEHGVLSDAADLSDVVWAMLEAGVELHCLRDLTRGGLASGLVELSEGVDLEFRLKCGRISVDPAVETACNLLGLDPMHVANEGRFVAVLPEGSVESALRVMAGRGHAGVVIGRVGAEGPAGVRLETEYGTESWVRMLSGAPLPRIC
ncbi:MAG: hydrogenase expression/formation protein HypE [Verrucomicrobiota bacterium]|jgi:hydrogenase expression/formation protein HypE